MAEVVDKALTAISRYNMLPPGSRVAAAVSGGADSVCLFLVLRELAPRLGFTVAGIAHLNHKLRGEASEEDERFVRALAERHGVAFFREEANVAAVSGNLEQAARRARQAFFSRLVREHGVHIATGHTQNDQAETVLFRVLRGSGLTGLAGILPVTREGLIRPLLAVSRAEVEDFLRARGIDWREDATNGDPGFARNRIRHTLLPALARDWNPEIGPALARLADTAREEELWWQAKVKRLAARLVVEGKDGLEVSASGLAALPRATARRLVRHAAAQSVAVVSACPLPDGRGSVPALNRHASACGQRLGEGARATVALEFDAVERVLDLAGGKRGRGTLDLPGLRVVRSFDRLRFMAPGVSTLPQPIPVSVPGRFEWPGEGTRVCLEVAESAPAAGGCVRLKLTSLKLCGGASAAPLMLRGWSAGDHYHPAGRFHDQKIKEMFQQARVPSWRRSFWPILCQGTEILWSREFGAAVEWGACPSGPALYVWEEVAGQEPEQEKHLKA